MRANRLNLLFSVLAALLLFSCKKKTEEFQAEPLSDYQPLQPGKYITYRLDSTVFTNFGSVTVTRYFQEKHIVDAQLTDALGRPSYRILRYTRDTAGTQPWVAAGTYFITPTNTTVEVIEDNLRFLKLTLPVKQDNTWKGNRYLPYDAYNTLFGSNFINNVGMADWDYTYDAVGETEVIKGHTYNDVITITGINESGNANPSNYTVIDPTGIAFVSILQEKYAKGLGLISQDYVLWSYQPPNGSAVQGVKVGFGIRRLIIDHN